MLGIVDNQLVRLEPVLEPRQLSVVLTENRIQGLAGGEPVETGVSYFVMKEDPGLDIQMNKRTGEFAVAKGYGEARLRAVFGNGHVDTTLVVARTEGPSVA